MTVHEAPWRTLAAVCWLVAAAVAAPPNISDMFKLTVYSSLQQERSVFDTLSPYPEGANLTLTCNMRVAKPQWWEWDEVLCPRSNENPDTGIHSIKFTISNLSARDHGRRLTCTSENKAVKAVTVTIYVISDIPQLHISYSSSNVSTAVVKQTAIPLGHQPTRLMCGTQGLDRHLQLCWFRNRTKLGCQARGESLTALQQPFSQEDAGTKLVCKPQMRHRELLEPEVRQMFENQFQSVQREVQITFTENKSEAARLPASSASPPQDDDPTITSLEQPCEEPSACDASCIMVDVVSREADDQIDGQGQGFLLATIKAGSAAERHSQAVCISDQDEVETAFKEPSVQAESCMPIQAESCMTVQAKSCIEAFYATIILSILILTAGIIIIVLGYKLYQTKRSAFGEQHISQKEEAMNSNEKAQLVTRDDGKGTE